MAFTKMDGVLLVIQTLIVFAASFPMKIPELNPKFEIGEKFFVSGVEDLVKLGNGTVPEALLTDLTPPEYYKSTGVNEHDALSHLYKTSTSANGRQRRSVSSSCPITWTVNFEANRWPSRIQRGICNGQGTTCLSSDGKRACEEYYSEVQVYRYLGQTSSGQQVWRVETQKIPVLCSCSAF
ncbi:uncharacterized protein LOC135695197 [Rhopilema esculentum]|uniref:uncharacterized protein LOC135695197 n=1 Tax=Rhopilema esculentum TaxID=499914 RepID=UPI0031DB346C